MLDGYCITYNAGNGRALTPKGEKQGLFGTTSNDFPGLLYPGCPKCELFTSKPTIDRKPIPTDIPKWYLLDVENAEVEIRKRLTYVRSRNADKFGRVF